MFRNLGKNYRMRGTAGNARTRAAKASKNKAGRKGDDDMMDEMMGDMMAMMMMGMGLDDDFLGPK